MKLFTKQLDPLFQKCSSFTSSTHQFQRGSATLETSHRLTVDVRLREWKSENIPMERQWNSFRTFQNGLRTFWNRLWTFHNNNNVGFEKLVQQSQCCLATFRSTRAGRKCLGQTVCPSVCLHPSVEREEGMSHRPKERQTAVVYHVQQETKWMPLLFCHTTVTVTDLLSTLALSLALYSFNYLNNRHTQGQSLAPGTCSTHTGSGLWPAGRLAL